LKLISGEKVETPEFWWQKRRPEIQAEFEKNIYGYLPSKIPDVKWEVKIIDREFVNRVPIIAKEIIGHVDNKHFPEINVNIKMILVVPTNVKGPVPVLMMFGRPSFPAPAQPSIEDIEVLNATFKEVMIDKNPALKAIFDKYPAYQPVTRINTNTFSIKPEHELTPQERLLAAGWGYCTIDPASIQADNGAGLTNGIIGLVNKGEFRKPSDWGALRAWAWGAARGLDYLETDTLVNAKIVGIEGVSRYGKAALVTMAFEPRFTIGLIGSSGKGGTTLHRRSFGEAVENLTGNGEYHWMAGNYLRYGAEESIFGKKTACDMLVDAHQLIAMAAPRPLFISYGIPEKGDAKWLDQEGSYKAVISAGEAYKLLGVGDLGLSNDYQNEKMPPMLTGLLSGNLAWRQHDGGHTDAPNFEHFILWAKRILK
jgi:hypothetical protein